MSSVWPALVSFGVAMFMSFVAYRAGYQRGFVRGLTLGVRKMLQQDKEMLLANFKTFLQQRYPLPKEDTDAEAEPDHRH
jgi:hypothetical protein